MDARHQSGRRVDLAGVGVGVEGLDHDAEQLHHLLGYDEHPGPRRGLRRLLVRDGDDLAVVVADVEGSAALALDGEHAGAAEVDHVGDQDPVGLGDAKAHDPLQPEHRLVDGVEVGGDPGALGQGERPGLGASALGCERRPGRGGSFEAFGGIEAGREEPVGPGEGEHLAQHPQGVGDVAAATEPVGWRFLVAMACERGDGDADLAVRVAVGAGKAGRRASGAARSARSPPPLGPPRRATARWPRGPPGSQV